MHTLRRQELALCPVDLANNTRESVRKAARSEGTARLGTGLSSQPGRDQRCPSAEQVRPPGDRGVLDIHKVTSVGGRPMARLPTFSIVSRAETE